jgi:hypothetical protein
MLMMENQKVPTRTNRYDNAIPTRKLYYAYKKKCKLENKEPIDEPLFSKILKSFHTKVKNRVLKENKPIRLPKINMVVQILKHRGNPLKHNGEINPKTFPVDWKETRKYWLKYPELKNKKFIYHLNDHTDGYIYRITLKRRLPIFKHSQFYQFKPNRTFSRELSLLLRDPYNKIDYYES